MRIVGAGSPRPLLARQSGCGNRAPTMGEAMKYDPVEHHRRSIRLKGYDYASPGAYFVTICVQDRECLLGRVIDGKMQLDAHGHIVDEFWQEIPIHFPNVSVDAYVTMPNHIHAIVLIHDPTHPGRIGVSAPQSRPTLGQIVAYYKYQTTKIINQMRKTRGVRFWQRNYWEHIIRTETANQRIYQYIQDNPTLWEDDQLHPDAPPNPFNRD